VTVFDVHRDGDDVLLAMELIEGWTLREWIAAEPRSHTDIMRKFIAAGAGLAAVHDAGLFHRDFKPANVMVDDAGHVTVLDFGLAVVGRTEGEVGGTPLYMAPEQYEGNADARADQYQFCLALLEVSSGRWPFDVRGRAALRRAKTEERLHPDALRGLPRHMAKVLRRGLAAAPEQRWPSMRALLEQLRPRRTRLRWLWVPALALAPLMMLPGRLTPAQVVEGCEDPSARLQGTWSPARARALRRVFLETGRDDEGEEFDRVHARVDAVIESWVDAYQAACAGVAQEDDVLDAKMRCLERSRQELEGVLDALMRVPPERLMMAARAVDRLSDAETCRTIDMSAEDGAPPLDDPEQAAEVAHLEGVMARRRGLHLAGDLDGALELANTVLEGATALGYEPLVAKALAAKAAELRALDRPEAIPVGEAAYEAARSLGYDRMAWFIVSDLATAYRRAGDYERAQWYFDESKSFVERLAEPEVEADRLSHLGALHLDMGDTLRALEVLERADVILARVARRTNAHGVVQRRIANILFNLERNDEARAMVMKARETLLLAEGPSNPELRGVKYLIGQLELRAGNREAGIAALEDALARTNRQLGSESKSAIQLQGALATALLDAGRWEQAEVELEAALSKADDAELSLRTRALLRRGAGRARLGRGDVDGALEHWNEGLRLCDSMPAIPIREVIILELVRLAAPAYEQQGQVQAAQELWDRVPPEARTLE